MTANQKQGQHRTRGTTWRDAQIRAPGNGYTERVLGPNGHRDRTEQSLAILAWLTVNGPGTAAQIYYDAIRARWPSWSKARVSTYLAGLVNTGHVDRLPGGIFRLKPA